MKSLAKLLGIDSEVYNQWQLHWLQEDSVEILLLLGIAIPSALWFFWGSLSRVDSRPRKLLFFGLRLAAFSLLLLILLKPELEFRKSESLKNSIVVLLDNSKSLSIKTNESPRIDLIKKTLTTNASYLEKLGKDFNVDFYFASDAIDKVRAGKVESLYQPHRPFTDFARVFEELAERYPEPTLQGIFLFSDGADLTQESGKISSSLMERIKALGSPIHTLQAGSNEGFKDLAIESVSASDFGFVQQPLRISLTIFSSSLGNRNVPLVLKEGGHILVSKIIAVREDTKRYEVELEFIPQNIGKRIYSLSLPKFSGEFILANNEKEFEINVVRDRIRVLHLNGRPSWDSRYLREVLAHNPKVDLLSFFILRNMNDDVEAPTTELSLIPFPSNLLFDDYLSSFDLIVFQNFKYDPFIDKKYLGNIRKYVQNGGAFLMIGGDLSFQGGGYSHTPIEEILPVSFEEISRSFVEKPFQPLLNQELLRHPILSLEKDPALNLGVWDSLPPLQGFNMGLLPEKNAHVLAKYAKKSTAPLLVVGKFGKGRTALLATDSMWNWNFRNVGDGGSGRYFQKLWNNVIDWLIAEPETRRLQLESDKDRYREGEKALIKFKLLKKNYQPAVDQTVQLFLKALKKESDSEAKLKTDERGEGVFPFLPSGEGFYKAKIKAKLEGESLEEEIMFSVLKDTAEFEKPLVNEHLLKKISEISGGEYLLLNGRDDLSSYMFTNPDVRTKSYGRSFSLWDNWWVYSLMLGFLVMEWFLRRKSGLS
ncbi:MAG: glutamine amidotransferase [Nitrospinia bacterium]